MNPRTCHCLSAQERTNCGLRAQLSGSHECPALAPWERELYGEREPFVDLYVTLKDGTESAYPYVRGIGVEYVKHASPSTERERTLTFEGMYGIHNVFDVVSWRTESCDQ